MKRTVLMEFIRNQLHLIIKFIYVWFVFKLITQFKAMTHLY